MERIRRTTCSIFSCSAALALTGCSQLGTLGASGQSTVTVTVEETPAERGGGQAVVDAPQGDNAPAVTPEARGGNKSAAGAREKRSS